MDRKSPILPQQSLSRLCAVAAAVRELRRDGDERVSSTRLGEILGEEPHNIRKDICRLGEIGSGGAGYDVGRLSEFLEMQLGLNRIRKACVVGLGRLGTAVLSYAGLQTAGIDMVAGFDSNVNRLETIRSAVKLYPGYRIPEVVHREGIELALLTVPGIVAQECTDRLIEGGIRGILNFTPTGVRYPRETVRVISVDLSRVLAMLSASVFLGESNDSQVC